MDLKKNPELIPLIEWWEKDGKSTVIWLLVAALAVGGWYGWKYRQETVRLATADAVRRAGLSAQDPDFYTVEELEDAVAKFGGSKAGGALKLRLAKRYFDFGRFEEALAQYEALIGQAPDGFADIPVVGKAQCLEALGKFAEAQKAFDDFAEANPKSYLALTAQLGAARSIAQAGDKAKALARIEALKAANTGDEIAKARVEATESVIKRLAKKAAPAAK